MTQYDTDDVPRGMASSSDRDHAGATANAGEGLRSSDEAAGAWALAQFKLGYEYLFRDGSDPILNADRAIECFEAAQTVWSQEKASDNWVAIQVNLGIAYANRRHGNPVENQERAIGYYMTALVIYTRNRNYEAVAQMQVNLADAYISRRTGDPSENIELAIAYCKRALNVYTIKDIKWVKVMNNLGLAYLRRPSGTQIENVMLAIQRLEAALIPGLRQVDSQEWAKIQMNLGYAYVLLPASAAADRIENPEKAIKHLGSALSVFIYRYAPIFWAMTRTNLGLAYLLRVRGDRAQNARRAIECLESTLPIFTRTEYPRDWALTQLNLGKAYAQRLDGSQAQNLERAIAHSTSALDFFTRENSEWGFIKRNLGGAYSLRLEGDPGTNRKHSVDCYKSALEHFAGNNKLEWARTLFGLGRLYGGNTKDDDSEEAIACLEEAFLALNREGLLADCGVVQLELGRVYLSRHGSDSSENLSLAIKYLRPAISVLRLTDPLEAVAALIALGEAELRTGNRLLAHATWREALEMREVLLTAGVGGERSAAARRSWDLVPRLVLLEVALGRSSTAVETLDRGRAVGLRSALQLDDIWLANLLDAIRIPIERTHRELKNLRARAFTASARTLPSVIREWEEELASKEAELVVLLAEARRLSAVIPPPSLDAGALSALAPRSGAVVLLAAAPDAGIAFVLPHLTSEGDCCIETVPLPGATAPVLREILTRWDSAYRTLLATAPLVSGALVTANAVLEGMLDELWQHVMGPVLARLPALGLGADAPLMLLPQGDLALMPLHAAGPARRGGRWRCVLDQHDVSYAPGGYALHTAAQRLAHHQAAGTVDATGRGQDFFGAFNPMQGTKQALPHAEDSEMPALRELFEKLGHTARCCVGQRQPGQPETPQASDQPWARVTQVLADSSVSGYVHFACHGHFDVANPAASGLQMADDELLTVPMIVRDLRLERCRLVTLSACETAMVDVIHLPDEFVGLPAAFLQAGAPGVVATFWSVLDWPTAEIISRFYALHLEGAGLPAATALRRAVQYLRNAGEKSDGDSRMRGHPQIDEAPEDDAVGETNCTLPPELHRLFALPIVWAAYAHHGA